MRRNPCEPSNCKVQKENNWIELIFVEVVNVHVNWNLFGINPWHDPKVASTSLESY